MAFQLGQAAAVLPQVRAGTLKAIANLSARRSQVMPEIPTADETGVPGLYLCGAATHPGGSVIGVNGRNAAMAVLADLKIDI
jgi:phytoene dehydrogenase-like protein